MELGLRRGFLSLNNPNNSLLRTTRVDKIIHFAYFVEPLSIEYIDAFSDYSNKIAVISLCNNFIGVLEIVFNQIYCPY